MKENKTPGGTIWAEGTHGIFIDGKPSKVHVNQESLGKTFKNLKANLPVPLGIDHLSDETLAANPILKKLDLLNVGQINAVDLTEKGIEITEAEITNPQVRELYAAGQLPSYSVVSDIFTRDCPELKADYVEEFSRIKRVDFVERGGCVTCKVEQPKLVNAKAIIKTKGVDNVKEGKKEGQAQEPAKNEGQPDKLDLILEKMDGIEGRLTALETQETGEEGEEEVKAGEEGLNPEIAQLQTEMETMKATARKAEAKGIVKGYLAEGKIAPANVEKHEALAMANPTEYQALMEDAPIVVDLTKVSQGAGEARETTEEDTSFGAFQAATGQNKEDK